MINKMSRVCIIMLQLKKRILVVLALLHVAASTCWTELSLVRTGTFQPITSLTPPTTNASSFSITLSTMVNTTNATSWGLSLVGYDTYLTSTFSYNVSVSIINNTVLLVTVQPNDNTYFVSIRMSYIVSGLNTATAPPLEVLHGCYKCLNISQNATGSASLTTRNENFLQNTQMTYSSTVEYRSFLYAFSYANSDGQLNYLELQTTLNNNGTYTHSIITKQYNIMSYACVTVIAWNSVTNTYGKGYAAFFQSYLLNSVTKSTTIKHYDGFDCNNLVFMGFSMISHTMGGERILGVHPETYSQIATSFDFNTYFSSSNINIFYIGYLLCDPMSSQIYVQSNLSCSATCTALYYANVSNECLPCNKSCLTCSNVDPNICLTCASGTYRNGTICNCSGLYFSNDSTNCLLCQTYMTYCKSCLNDSVCLACKNNTYLVNGKCQCLNLPVQTYNITGICLTYPGCVSAANVLNANYCSSCNTSANFKHPSDSNLTCICMSGYNNSDNPLACTPICGDGIINLEACDDNNTANGDGCSNKCIIESNWFCYTSSGTTGPSHCLPISSASISYLYAQRVVGTNTAKMYFTFTPAGANLSANALQGGVTTNAPISSITTTYSSSNSRITLLVEFTSSMQSNSYNFYFNFSSTETFYSPLVTANVKANGINEPLYIESYGIFVKTFQFIFIGMSALAMILGATSAIVGYKLMGLQLLLPIQAAFFAEFSLANPPPYLSSLKYLKFSNGFNQIFAYNYEDFYLSNSNFAKFDYEVQMALNLNVMPGILLLSTVALLIFQVIYLCYHSKAYTEQLPKFPIVEQTKKNNNKGKKQEKVEFEVKEEGETGEGLKSARLRRNSFVNNFYFYLATALSEQCLFAFVVQNMQVSVKEMVVSEDINLTMGYATLLLVIGNFIFLLSQLGEKKQKRILTFHETKILKYPAFLICSYMLLVLAISLTQSYSFDPFITTVASIVPLIGLIYLRPYRNDEGKLNAISAFVNLAFPLVASAIYLANSIINMSEFGWIISTIIVFVWLLMTEIIAVVRMVKIIPWKDIPLLQKCMKKGKKQVDGLLDKVKGEIQMSNIVKESITGEEKSKMIDWQQKNKKEYESIRSKPDQDDDAQNSEDNQQEDELAQLKKRLKKQIKLKRAL